MPSGRHRHSGTGRTRAQRKTNLIPHHVLRVVVVSILKRSPVSGEEHGRTRTFVLLFSGVLQHSPSEILEIPKRSIQLSYANFLGSPSPLSAFRFLIPVVFYPGASWILGERAALRWPSRKCPPMRSFRPPISQASWTVSPPKSMRLFPSFTSRIYTRIDKLSTYVYFRPKSLKLFPILYKLPVLSTLRNTTGRATYAIPPCRTVSQSRLTPVVFLALLRAEPAAHLIGWEQYLEVCRMF